MERALRWNIGTGVWRPGDAIPSERELASEFGVGRATLRSAINVLRADGLLVTSVGRNGRTRIAEAPSRKPATSLEPQARHDILCHFELRCAVESAAAELAAARGTTKDFDRLRDIMRQPVSSVRTYHALESQFHIALADACGNPLMSNAIAGLCVDFFDWADRLAVANADCLPETYRDFATTHKPIYETLMTRDGQAAREAVVVRLVDARNAYLEFFGEGVAT